jgi:YVTN family beta-propeller protein
MFRRLLPVVLATTLAAGAAAAQTPSYTLTRSVALGAPERWDYVVFDPPTGRVYVAHGDRLSVVDGKSGALIGEVTGIPGGTHGIGLSGGKGYTDDGQAGVAVVFDPKTLKVLKTIPAAPDADGIAVDPLTGHVFVVNGNSKTLTVIDPKTDQAVATVEGGGGLEYAVAGPGGKLYVNGAENKEILRVDTRTNQVDARWPVPDCTSPHGLAIDPALHRLFTTCVNQVLTVLDTDTGAVVATLPIGAGTDGAAFDPARKRVFSSNNDGTVTVIAENGPNNFTVAGAVTTQVTGKNMGIDPATGRLYVVVADIDPAAPVPVGPNGRPGRPKPLPGTLKLLFLDPAR